MEARRRHLQGDHLLLCAERRGHAPGLVSARPRRLPPRQPSAVRRAVPCHAPVPSWQPRLPLGVRGLAVLPLRSACAWRSITAAQCHPSLRRYTRGTGGAILPGDAPFAGQPFHLVFNLAVGGVHVGADRAACLETLKTPKYMMVDWVRVYTKK